MVVEAVAIKPSVQAGKIKGKEREGNIPIWKAKIPDRLLYMSYCIT